MRVDTTRSGRVPHSQTRLNEVDLAALGSEVRSFVDAVQQIQNSWAVDCFRKELVDVGRPARINVGENVRVQGGQPAINRSRQALAGVAIVGPNTVAESGGT